MNSIADASLQAIGLVASGDPKLFDIVLLSLGVRLSAVVLGCAIGLPLGGAGNPRKIPDYGCSSSCDLGGQTYEDDVSITPEELYTRLRTAKSMPSTSQVSVVNMHKAYDTLLEQGYDVLGIFLSQKLSGTWQSAQLAKEELKTGKEKVDFVDSETTAMALGFIVLHVAKAAMEGASLAESKALAEEARKHVGVYLTVETLEFLHRGGRIGGATRFLGTALNLKPILAEEGGTPQLCTAV